MPVYRDNKTKTWYFRTYANDVYGNRKQYERHGFATKKEAQKAETDFKVLDPNDISNMKFIDLWEAYRDYKQLQLKNSHSELLKVDLETIYCRILKIINLIR